MGVLIQAGSHGSTDNSPKGGLTFRLVYNKCLKMKKDHRSISSLRLGPMVPFYSSHGLPIRNVVFLLIQKVLQKKG